jgi:endonuclease/exonuclease/phosphatase (EEP) superfamily protein YafD
VERPRTARRSTNRTAINLGLVAVGAAPWTWFVLRDHLGTFGDLLSLGMPFLVLPALAIVAMTVVWIHVRVVAAWFASWTLVALLVVFGPRLPQRMGTPVDPFTLVAANVRFDNPTPHAAARDLLEFDADVLVVPETTPEIIGDVRPHYEYFTEVEDDGGPYGTAVFSRYPLDDVRTIDVGNGVVRATVGAPHEFVLVAAHLDRPSVSPGSSGYVTHGEHFDEVRALHAAIEDEELPVVIAGDLNLSDRVRGYRYLDRRYVDLARDGWAGTTYMGGVYRYFLLRIDHVFASGGWCSEHVDEFTITGSDHRGLRLDVGPCD